MVRHNSFVSLGQKYMPRENQAYPRVFSNRRNWSFLLHRCKQIHCDKPEVNPFILKFISSPFLGIAVFSDFIASAFQGNV